MSATTAVSTPKVPIRWAPSDKQRFFKHALSVRKTDEKLPAKHVAKLAMMMMPPELRRPSEPAVDPVLTTEMNKYVKSTFAKPAKARKAIKQRAVKAATPIKRRPTRRRVKKSAPHSVGFHPHTAAKKSVAHNELVLSKQASLSIEGSRVRVTLEAGGSVTIHIDGREVIVCAKEVA